CARLENINVERIASSWERGRPARRGTHRHLAEHGGRDARVPRLRPAARGAGRDARGARRASVSRFTAAFHCARLENINVERIASSQPGSAGVPPAVARMTIRASTAGETPAFPGYDRQLVCASVIAFSRSLRTAACVCGTA